MYKRIKEQREKAELSIVKCANILNIGKNTYIRYEKGENDIPLETAIKLADLYDISLDYLAERTDEKILKGKKL